MKFYGVLITRYCTEVTNKVFKYVWGNSSIGIDHLLGRMLAITGLIRNSIFFLSLLTELFSDHGSVVLMVDT